MVVQLSRGTPRLTRFDYLVMAVNFRCERPTARWERATYLSQVEAAWAFLETVSERSLENQGTKLYYDWFDSDLDWEFQMWVEAVL